MSELTVSNEELLLIALTRIERAVESYETDGGPAVAALVLADIKKFAREAIEVFEIPSGEDES